MMAKSCPIFIVLIIISVSNGHDFIVDTTIGLVRGYPAADGDYINYLGIPYGIVNEDNPFGAAIPQPVFEEIFEAVDDSARCPQQEEFNYTIVGTLDCLHLNVHVPSSAGPNNLLPVFVWIFGGGFELGFFGRFLYGPKFLTRHDIIVVSLNYRLGPYGFMSLDTPEVPGNQGLKDQLMALRWIRDNIQAFGGDPKKITISGNSAGSMSVNHHILRVEDGPPLFHKAGLQSGTTLGAPPGIPNTQSPLLIAQYLGFETTDIDEALTFLARQDPLEVIRVVKEADLSFSIVVEKEFEAVESFIIENWINVRDMPNVVDMPILIGFSDDEALLLGFLFEEQSYPLIIPLVLASVFDATHPDFAKIVEDMQNFYFGADENPVQQLIDFLGDFLFIHPNHRTIERFLDNGVGNVYLYEYSYVGERNFVKHRENVTHGGAVHADELGYLFDISYMDEPSDDDQRVIDTMTAMWANFVKYGDPTPETSELLPYKWQAITKDSPYHYMKINLELGVGTRPLQERMTFWDLLYDGYGHLQSDITSDGLLRRLLQQLHF